MNKYSLTVLFLLLLVISACGNQPQPTPISNPTDPPPSQTPPSTELVPVIFDDDGSPDGTTALMYLLNHPLADLAAVNISYGEAHPEIYIQHIGRQLESFGIVDLPLGYGQDGPLAGENEFPEGVRQASNDFWGQPIPYPEKTYPVQPSPELIVSIINESPLPVTVFVSGPCTNLAQALQLDPGITNNIQAVYIMGGAVYAPGNIQDFYPESENISAEWNIFADSQAAGIVFESGVDIFLVPLDATNQVTISREDTRQWRLGGGAADFAADIYDMLLNNWGADEAAIWDLMTAAIMLKPGLCGFQALHLQVITEAGPTSGQTAVVPGEAANISVCLEPDADGIRQTLIEIFSGE